MKFEFLSIKETHRYYYYLKIKFIMYFLDLFLKEVTVYIAFHAEFVCLFP